jgi:DHA1 family tetracycline resistance protein-like MFS transporter
MDAADSPETQPEAGAAAVAPAPDPAARARRHAMLIVFLVVFIDLLGFGIVLPLLPLYALELLEPLLPGLDHRPLRGLLLGLLMSSFSAMQFLFAPVWGRLSDRIGRRSILLVGLGASVIFYTLFGIASEIGAQGHLVLALALLFIARLGAGIAGATISTAQAVIADTTTPEKRSHGMALIGVAFGIGFTFGPLLGFASLLVPLKGAPGFAAAAFSLTAFLLAVRLLPETWRPDAERRERRLLDWRGLQNTLQTPTVGILVLTFFLATFAFGSLESTLSLVNRLLLYGEQDLQVDVTAEAMRSMESKNFLIFAYIGLVLMLAQGLLYRRLVKRVGEVAFLRAGTVFMALGLVGATVILLVRHDVEARTALLWPALGVMTLAVLGFACLTPSVQALVSRRSDPNRQGEVLGVNQSAAALARILGPLLGLLLFHMTPSHALPYACSVVLLALVFLLTLRIQPD